MRSATAHVSLADNGSRVARRPGQRCRFPEDLAQRAPRRPAHGGTKLRRIPIEREDSVTAIVAALPAGHVRPATQGEWWTHFLDVLDSSPLRVDGRATARAIGRALMLRANWDTLTVRCPWAALQGATGYSRATVARYLARFREWGLIGVVASGRAAEYTPHQEHGEVAVYVLAVPYVDNAVDEVETPTQLSAGEEEPPRASALAPARVPQTEPLRGPDFPAARARPPERRPDRHTPAWPSCATAQRKDDRKLAAAELRRRLPVLRAISDAYVAAVLRPFMLAGWTVADVVWCIDHRPDNTPWPHTGSTGVAHVAAWFSYRMHAWTVEGEPMRSPSQRSAADAALTKARQRVAREQYERDLAASRSSETSLAREHCLGRCPDQCEYCDADEAKGLARKCGRVHRARPRRRP